MKRENRFELRLSDDEHKMLNEVAEQLGVSAADVLRNAIRMAHMTMRLSPKPPQVA